jgi:O-antigen/teichoic acid export membrane protein
MVKDAKTLYPDPPVKSPGILAGSTVRIRDWRAQFGKLSHARRRYLRASVTTVGLLAARCVGSLLNLVLTPFALRHLGAELFGMWMTITSITALLSIANMGINQGMVNIVASAAGRGNNEEAATAVSTAFFLLCAIAAGLGSIFWAIFHFVPWYSLFNVTSPTAIAEAPYVILIFAGFFLLNMPLGAVTQTQIAYQEGYRSSPWELGGRGLGFLIALFALSHGVGTTGLLLGLLGGPAVALAANGVNLFWFRRPYLRPSWKVVNASVAKKTLNLGFLFLALQVGVAVAFMSDNLIVARILGASAVAQYAVPSSMFAFGSGFIMTAFTPFWPAYAEAHASNDFLWIRRTLRLSVLWGGVSASCFAALLGIFARPILKMWVGASIHPSPTLILGLAVWTVMQVVGTSIGIFLNGIGVIRFQVAATLALAILGTIAKITLTRRMGIAGPVWGTIFAYTISFLVPTIFYLPILYNKMTMAPSASHV